MDFLEVGGTMNRGPSWDSIGMQAEIRHDLTSPMPIANETYDGIFSEHFIEHLYKHEGIRFLKECKRILKPDGVLRIAWPAYEHIEWLTSEENLEDHFYVKEFMRLWKFWNSKQLAGWTTPPDKSKSDQENIALHLLHQDGEHKYIWGREELINTLTSLGFKGVRSIVTQNSRIEEFKRIEFRLPIRDFETTIVEASA